MWVSRYYVHLIHSYDFSTQRLKVAEKTQLNLTTEMQANPLLHRGLVLQGAPVKADGRMGRRISTAPL